MPVWPSTVPVPTMPGPMATMATPAPTTWRAAASPEKTFTHSRSPPKACPQVMVTSMTPLSLRRATRSLWASGSAAPSVMR